MPFWIPHEWRGEIYIMESNVIIFNHKELAVLTVSPTDYQEILRGQGADDWIIDDDDEESQPGSMHQQNRQPDRHLSQSEVLAILKKIIDSQLTRQRRVKAPVRVDIGIA